MGPIRMGKLLLLLIILFIPFSIHSEEFYEKAEILARMENKREVISVVKIIPHPKANEKVKVLDMTAVGLIEGVSVSRAMELMVNYQNLQKIAPDYIKLSELIVRKEKGKYQKYIHMKTEVKTIVGTYKVEVFSKIREEKTADKGFVHWEIVNGSSIGRKNAPGDFIGLKGYVLVKKHTKKGNTTARNVRGVGAVYRNRPQKEQAMMIFKGRLERDRAGMTKVIPNFILQFAMEVALQRVGILLRNYLETEKDAPQTHSLEDLAQKEERKASSVTPPSH